MHDNNPNPRALQNDAMRAAAAASIFVLAAILQLVVAASPAFPAPSRESLSPCRAVPSIAALRTEHVRMMNAIRARNDLGGFSADTRLDHIAQQYACLLAATGHFGHVGPDGSTLAERVRAGGDDFCLVAENLALGQSSLREAVLAWVRSPEHWRNMRLPGARVVGLGLAFPSGEDQAGPARLSQLRQSLADQAPAPTMTARQYVWVQLLGAPCE